MYFHNYTISLAEGINTHWDNFCVWWLSLSGGISAGQGLLYVICYMWYESRLRIIHNLNAKINKRKAFSFPEWGENRGGDRDTRAVKYLTLHNIWKEMEVEIETLAQQFIKLGLSSEVEVWYSWWWRNPNKLFHHSRFWTLPAVQVWWGKSWERQVTTR